MTEFQLVKGKTYMTKSTVQKGKENESPFYINSDGLHYETICLCMGKEALFLFDLPEN